MALIDKTVDKIHEAVQEAIGAGMSPKEFIRNAWVSWEQELNEQKGYIAKIFEKALQ